MEFTQRAKNIMVALWFIFVPLGTLLVYLNSPTKPTDWENYGYYLLLALLSSVFPFVIAGSTIVLVLWVNVAIFMKFGILAELISMQLCMFPIIYHMKITRETLFKYFFNSSMFFFLSVICGSLIIGFGFEVGSVNIMEVVMFGSLYAVSYILINHIILYGREVICGFNPLFLTKDFYWETACLLMTLPFGLSLYLFETAIGPIALLLMGIPLMTITVIVRLYSDSEKVNNDLNKASEFGHELAERLTSNEILDIFVERVSNMFPIDSAYIVDNLNGKFIILRAMVDGRMKELEFSHEEIQNSFAGVCYHKGEPTLFNKQVEWISQKPPFLSSDMQSVMCVPIYRNKKIEGVLVLATKSKFAFEPYQLNIVHLLCSYFAVSLEKARFVREAVEQSEVCELTKLFNYKYLDKQIAADMAKVETGAFHSLSLIMLDIDKFKAVNDTYGHHSGNIILKEFASILKIEIGKEGTVGRYGGEEFVVILPNYTKLQAMNLAEQLRLKIEQTPFMVELDLADVTREEIIFITASIGVSTAPEDSDEGNSLIRNADRALYIGAKQAGRNRVAEYVKS